MGRPGTTIVISEDYQQLAQAFYENQLQLGYVPHSARSKWRRVKEFLQYAETFISTDISAITTQHVLQFYQYQQQRPSKKDGKHLHPKTLWDYIRAIQDFYTLLQHTGKASVNPTNTIRIQHPKTQSARIALTQGEIKELYQHTKTLQERAILALAYGCGLRVSELVQCNIADVRLREQILHVPKGKGNKSRIIPLSKTVVKDLSNYFFKVRLQQVSKDPQAFILHSKLKRMQKGTYNKILQQLIGRTENAVLKAKQISIHNLRHSIATHLIEQGVPLEKVREFLGHSQLESTEVYTHISSLQLKELVA
jgi:integrase/recombinase XerD